MGLAVGVRTRTVAWTGVNAPELALYDALAIPKNYPICRQYYDLRRSGGLRLLSEIYF